MHRSAFIVIVFSFYLSLYISVSEGINFRLISKSKKWQKRPSKKGITPLSSEAKEAYSKIQLPKNVTFSHRQGLNFDYCETDFDCLGDRYCYGYNAAGALGYCDSTFNSGCSCLPTSSALCQYDSDCSEGEHCSTNVLPSTYFCVSDTFLGPVDDGLPKPGSQGLALGYCMYNSDCQSPLYCYMLDYEGYYESCDPSAGKECFCDYDFTAPVDNGECKSDSDCKTGEICPSYSFDYDWCVSTTAYQGFNFDFCYSSSECREPRSCYMVLSDGSMFDCSPGDDSCVCMKDDTYDMLCSDLYDCAFWAESCYYDETSGYSFCVSDAQLSLLRAKKFSKVIKANMHGHESPEVTYEEVGSGLVPTSDDEMQMAPVISSPIPSTSPNASSDASPDTSPVAFPDGSPVSSSKSSTVCIAVHSLGHLQPHELMYETHQIARVLCDNTNSCATPGHIVKYQGTPMMMKNYCEMVACKSDIMKVNSPRYQRGMQVPSMTKDLVFTAFAARYETKAEERVLATAIRLGL